jgi:hypothetical protein
VVEPLTNVTLPLASVFMMLLKPLISLTLLILVYVYPIFTAIQALPSSIIFQTLPTDI